MSFHFTRLDSIYKQISKIPLVILSIVLLISGNSFAKNKVTLLTPPSPGEFYFEVANEIFKISGTNVNKKVEPYPSIYKKMSSTKLESKEVFASIAVLNEKNLEKFHNILNIMSIETSFYTLNGSNKKIKTIDEVKNLGSICVWLDSVLNRYLINQGFENLIPAPTLKQCTSLLFNGKVDALYASESRLIKTARVNGYDVRKLKKGLTPMRVTFFLAITKNAPHDLVAKLTNSGKQFKSSGCFDEILDKHRKDLFLLQ